MKSVQVAFVLSCIAILSVSAVREDAKDKIKHVIEDVICESCMVFTKSFAETMKDVKAMDDIVRFTVENFCPIFGKGANKCVDYSKSKEGNVLKALFALNATNVCHKFDACKVKTQKKIVEEIVEEKIDGEIAAENGLMKCHLCQTVVRFVEEEVAGHISEKKVIAALDKVCNKLPFFKAPCRNLVENNLKHALDHLKAKLTPLEICVDFNWC